MTWGIFAIISFQLADLFFVGMLGVDQLAALSFTMPITMIVFSILLGLTIAMSSVISRQIGEKNYDRVVRIITHGLVFAFIVSAFIAIIGLGFMEQIFGLIGADHRFMPYINEYMSIWYIANILTALPMVGNAAIRAHGDTVFPAIIMTVSAVLNIILDPILIFGLGPIPAYGIQGAAIASLIASSCTATAGLAMLGFKMKLIRLRPFYFDKFGDSIKRLLFIALPAGITSAIQPITNGVIISLLAAYGPEAVAAAGIANRVDAFAFIVLMGLAGGMSPILGQNWGAKNYGRVNETLRKALGFSVIWGAIIATGLFIFAEQVAGMFSDEEKVIEIARLYFWIIPISYIAGNLISGWSSAFNAIGMPQYSAMMLLFKNIIILIPAVIIGNKLGGITGIFCAIASVNTVLGISFHFWNRHMCLTKQSQPA